MTNIKNTKQEKQTYRDQARIHRERLPVDSTDFEKIIDVFFEQFKPSKSQVIALYWPVGKEFDCRFLMDELVTQGFKAALPKLEKGSRILNFVPWAHESTMVKNALGIPEPESEETLLPDIVIAPLLAFDQKGFRLGQGGGYYDATLESLRAEKDILYIGIGYAEQAVLFKLPNEPHDIPLDVVLTPQGVIDFGDRA
jgi:5-formyltetrahydrofolate cyclo-ligase